MEGFRNRPFAAAFLAATIVILAQAPDAWLAAQLIDIEWVHPSVAAYAATLISMLVGVLLVIALILGVRHFVVEWKNCSVRWAVFAGIGGSLSVFLIWAARTIFNDWPAADIAFISAVFRAHWHEAVIVLVPPLLLAPLAEEMIFRKWLFDGLLLSKGRVVAYLVSAGLFGLIHPHQLQALMSGLIFAAIREKSGSWIYSFIAHVTFNVLITAMYAFHAGA